MKSDHKIWQQLTVIFILGLFISLSSMSACISCRVGRGGFNPSKMVIYDSIYFANGYYGYWYSYELGSFCGSIGDFISISNNRNNINYDNQVIVSEYIEGIRKISDKELQVILTVDTYDDLHDQFQGINISVSFE